MKKKKILWHLPYAIVGGVETAYVTLLKYIDKEEFEHYVTCHTAIRGWVESKFRGKAITIMFEDQFDIARILRSVKPDLIFGTHGRSLYEGIDESEMDIPVIEVVHGSHIWSEHNVFMPKTYTRHILCVSKTAEKVYLENTNEKGIPTSVIINGIDTELFHPVKALAKEAKSIGYMGRFLESDKHIKKIIQAFKSIGDAQSKLYLIGGQPGEIVQLKHFIRSLKLKNNVKLYGHTPNPEKFFKNLDMYTVRSEAEGYCNSAAEALATGTPCVCFDFGGILEHIPPGTIAVAKSQKEYAQLLSQVYHDFNLRKDMRRKGLEFIQKEGNAKIMAKKYVELIKDVLSRSTTKTNEVRVSASKDKIGHTTILNKDNRGVVGVCNLAWHGIATATKNICDHVVGWHRDPRMMARNISRKNPRAILFSGMCPGFGNAAEILRRELPKVPIYVYYHGGISHFSFMTGLFGDGERNAFQQIITYHKKRVFKRIAVSYPGLAEALQKSGIDAHFCGNLMPEIDVDHVKPLKGIHIGNWNRHHDHKHTSIGLAVANLLDGQLHCLKGYPKVPGLDTSLVIEYNEMTQTMLYRKYAEMTVCLQLGFIETFNISVLEMWACGVPVMVGCGNYVLVKDAPLLEELCYVKDTTNPVAIADQIRKVINNREKVVKAQYEHLKKLRQEVTERWERFLS
jgi:glycosyltransferase involved in cell wall biosynthesis